MGMDVEPAKLEDLATEPLLRYFAYIHGEDLRSLTEEAYSTLAFHIMEIPRSEGRTVALRKLLESRDSAMRAIAT